MLSIFVKYLSNLLEQVQKRTLRVIYGFGLSYAELLEKSGLPTLEERRSLAFRKFAEKTVKNPKYSDRWFPKRTIAHPTRHSNKFIEEQATGNRLCQSPIFAMRRMLNRRTEEDQVVFNDPF